ncbi:MAG TPA: tRNA dihydrouridine synthase DusB, partial [Pusillimonas sp.]|nr:tRNA dihydrouridine synthase DusB [Pusillimonas sp.]
EYTGVRSARKHVGWYLGKLPQSAPLIQRINQSERSHEQVAALTAWFNQFPPEQYLTKPTQALAA